MKIGLYRSQNSTPFSAEFYFISRCSFFKANVTLMPKPAKDIIRRDNYRQIFLMNTDVKILKKALAYTMTK